MKKIWAILLAFCLLLGTGSWAVYADDTVELDKAMGDSYVEEENMDVPLKPGLKASTPKAPSGTVAKGVDISYHNGTINFSKLKNSVDFVIIRCGYGSDMTSQDDKKFEQYVKGCRDYNIPYGIYLYSYANTVAKAKSEGQHALRLVDKCKNWNTSPSLPIFYDMEDPVQSSASKTLKGQMAKAFCDILEAKGYKTGIYASKYWWTNYLTASYFNNVTKWVAQYNTSCTYTKSYAIWQCTSSASVSGISGKADLNYMIKDIYIKQSSVPSESTTETVSSSTTAATAATTAKPTTTATTAKPTTVTKKKISSCKFSSIGNKTYTGKQIKPSITVKYSGKKLVKGKDYTLSYGKNKSTGKATVKVTGKGNYTGSSTRTFYIVPKKTSITSIKKAKKGGTIKFKKVTGATGYQVAYRKKGTSKWYYAYVKSNKKKFTGLKYKTYTVKVRAYKTVSGKKHYGSYSASKTMKTK